MTALNLLLSCLLEIAWPLVTVAVAYWLHDGLKQWISREATTIRELREELRRTQEDWTKHFSTQQKAHDQLASLVKHISAAPNPLGRSYNPRSG